jgi:hypothetical protein
MWAEQTSARCNWGSNGLWLPLTAAGKNDCFAAVAVGRRWTPSSQSRLQCGPRCSSFSAGVAGTAPTDKEQMTMPVRPAFLVLAPISVAFVAYLVLDDAPHARPDLHPMVRVEDGVQAQFYWFKGKRMAWLGTPLIRAIRRSGRWLCGRPPSRTPCRDGHRISFAPARPASSFGRTRSRESPTRCSTSSSRGLESAPCQVELFGFTLLIFHPVGAGNSHPASPPSEGLRGDHEKCCLRCRPRRVRTSTRRRLFPLPLQAASAVRFEELPSASQPRVLGGYRRWPRDQHRR